MSSTRSLSFARSALLTAYTYDLIDDVEFALLYDVNKSREVYPHWKFNQFDFDALDESQCRIDFRFNKNDIPLLLDVFQLPQTIICSQGTVCSDIEGLCLLLRRLAFPCRYSDLASTFGRNPTEMCLIFNKVLDHIYNTHSTKVTAWNYRLLAPNLLRQYADAIHLKGAPLDNCFGLIDGTVRRIARPKDNQRIVYNGHKRVHCLKYQSLALPNGIIANMSGPYEGKKHDSTMLYESGLLVSLQQNAWYNGVPLCIYGDPAYPLKVHLQAPFSTLNITPNQRSYNKSMSEVRIGVEWLFGEITNYFKFVDFKKMQKIGLSPLGKLYIVCALLQNALTCLYGNIVSEYFEVQPPTLHDYFR